MIVFKDRISGDEMFADSYPMREIQDGFFYEVDGKWTTVGDVDIDIGANPSAEEAEEGVESTDRNTVDIIESFRLNEQPTYDKKQFMGWAKEWSQSLLKKLSDEEAADFKAKSSAGIKFLLGKLKELQFFFGESMDTEATLCFAYYKDGASDPTFIFFKHGLLEQKM
ncbi:g783 [Coccomyxa viridis]|uniref:G783 protein n=1 Tax=Coccomyxa viridis TaxID=1274662 RepID=A0ABP1FGH7_9CHLO